MTRFSRVLSFICGGVAIAVILATNGHPAFADQGDSSAPVAYAKFIDGAQVQTGLFTLIRKDSKVYIAIAPSQLGQDFVQTAEQTNGLGGWGSIPGGINSLARIIRFTKTDDKIVATWPNEFFQARGNPPAERAIGQTFADSPIAVAPIVATDALTGKVVFDASFFLNDIYNLTAQLKQITGPDNPEQAYRLDSDRTLFGPTKAFPDNVIITADQTWASDDPQVVDNVPDPRWLHFRIAYNIVSPPSDGDYMPRIADDRVGFFDAAHLNFANDRNFSRIVRYVVRWNMQPTDPTKSLSPAKHPMIYSLANNIPDEYRAPIRRALLSWNDAFRKIGISDAVQVKDQPDDPNWDPDDVRYNTIIWMTESNGGGYAAENPVWDPRTGQMIRTNIVCDADVMQYSNTTWQFTIEPTNGGTYRFGNDRRLAEAKREQAVFGRVALASMGHPLTGSALQRYNEDLLQSFIVHEAGHGFGLQHNFIGSMAYTPKQLQSKSFTQRYGVATSVMEYAGLNLWPKGYPQGTFWQTVLGPYDYYAIRWGYGRVAGARTPEAELPTLNQWASQWNNPLYRFASDEDVSYRDAHAIDPRVSQFDLTSDPLSWGEAQLKLSDHILQTLDHHFPQYGHTYDEERAAFESAFFTELANGARPEHYIAGEYLSRSHVGDRGASTPLVQVSRSDELRAFSQMRRYLLGDDAWHFSPATLNRLVYSEWETIQGGAWAYNPPPRHDEPVAEFVEGTQQFVLQQMFQPLMLQRLDDLSLKAKPGSTMSLTDLFNWTQDAVYSDLKDPKLNSIGLIHRSLQQSYARMLGRLWLAPATSGMPYDAESLARAKLVSLRDDIGGALRRPNLDELTRAHLQNLADVVSRILDSRQVEQMR